MSEAAVRLTVQQCVATVTIDRPAVRNALDHEGWLALRDRLHAATQDPAVRAVVLTGSGDRAFCAGADLRQPLMTGTEVREQAGLPPPLQAVREIQRSTKPVVVAINGDAIGGGCELALAAHIRIAARTARLGWPEIRFGLVPAAARVLPRIIGSSAAFELLLVGDLISATEAQRLGLVSRVLDQERVLEEATALAQTLAQRDPFAVAGTLALAEAGRVLGTEDALRAAGVYFAAAPPRAARSASDDPADRPQPAAVPRERTPQQDHGRGRA